MGSMNVEYYCVLVGLYDSNREMGVSGSEWWINKPMAACLLQASWVCNRGQGGKQIQKKYTPVH